MVVNIKQSNQNLIHRSFNLSDDNVITGIKLAALYKLIHLKGEPIKTKDKKLNNVMALEYKKGCFIAMVHTPTVEGSFYPCAIKKISLVAL